jgi:5-oxoprolinase (ATP-hydrolysing)
MGCNYVERAEGTRIELRGADRAKTKRGDVFAFGTPGGGGYGPPA